MYLNTRPVSAEARQLYLAFDPLITSMWSPVHSYSAFLAPVARWLPSPTWRSLWHELGTHRLLAYKVQNGVDYISYWCGRYPANPRKHLLSKMTRTTLLASYSDWTKFDWDSWSAVLQSCGVHTEAFWQLNNAYSILTSSNRLLSRRVGTTLEVRAKIKDLYVD